MAERGAFPGIDHPVSGTVRVTATPFPPGYKAVAPAGPLPYRIGQHIREVSGHLPGYSQKCVEELVAAGSVSAASQD